MIMCWLKGFPRGIQSKQRLVNGGLEVQNFTDNQLHLF